MISYRRNLNMTPGEVPLIVYVSQYDEDFQLIFDLYSSNGTISVPSGTTAAIRGTKKDGNVYSAAATVSGNSVTVAGHKQMTAIAGKNIFEITLYNNGQELSSANFILCVEPSAMDVDKIPSDSSIRELADVISRADEIVGSAAEIAQIAEDLSTEYQNTKNMIATVEDTATSSKSYNVGDFLIYNDKLYQVIRSISSGDTITIGTNVLETIVGEELYSLHKLKASVIISHAEDDTIELDDGADDMPIKSLISTIEPVQDFHGYDKPWVGGAGKNLFDVDEINRLHKGVTFVNETDSAGNCIGVKLTGAYSNETATATLGHVVLSSGSYIVSGGAENVMLSIRPGSSSASQIGQVTTNEVTITLTAETDIYLVVRVTGTFTSGLVIKPMIRLASVIDSTYEPYENICPIDGWEELHGGIAGVNWLPNNLIFTDGLRNDSGELTTSPASHHSAPIPVRPNTVYTLSGHVQTNTTSFRVYFLTVDQGWISRTGTLNVASYTFTTPSNCYFIQVQCSVSLDLSDAMLALGNLTTFNEFVGNNTFSISWQTEAGAVYSGTVNPISGVLIADQAFKQYSGANTEHWTYSTWTKENTLAAFANDDLADAVHGVGGINYMCITACNELALTSYNNLQIYDVSGITISGGGPAYVSIRVPKTIATDVATLQTYLASHPLQIVYELASPITYQLTSRQINTLLGQNYIWTDAGMVSVDYPVDTKIYVDNIVASHVAILG